MKASEERSTVMIVEEWTTTQSGKDRGAVGMGVREVEVAGSAPCIKVSMPCVERSMLCVEGPTSFFNTSYISSSGLEKYLPFHTKSKY